MTREEFRNSFVNNAYSFSCMTVKDLMNIIESWPSDNMPFCIEDEWSWRGIYADPCLYVSNAIQAKSHNLRMLHELLKYSFAGWKGGEFYYNESSFLHFENDPGCATTIPENSFWLDFLKKNEDNKFVQAIYEYFENDKHLNNEYYQDFLGQDFSVGTKCVYWTEDGFAHGMINSVDQSSKHVRIAQKINDWEYEQHPNFMHFAEFDKVIQFRD